MYQAFANTTAKNLFVQLEQFSQQFIVAIVIQNLTFVLTCSRRKLQMVYQQGSLQTWPARRKATSYPIKSTKDDIQMAS